VHRVLESTEIERNRFELILDTNTVVWLSNDLFTRLLWNLLIYSD